MKSKANLRVIARLSRQMRMTEKSGIYGRKRKRLARIAPDVIEAMSDVKPRKLSRRDKQHRAELAAASAAMIKPIIR